mmetsp:Transcript_16403/g.33698  ORF Transcript_16403/g.33698 Transcript_16403/m.33698 type:complete len:136 (+) Transcript_16403:485-892(+)
MVPSVFYEMKRNETSRNETKRNEPTDQSDTQGIAHCACLPFLLLCFGVRTERDTRANRSMQRSNSRSQNQKRNATQRPRLWPNARGTDQNPISGTQNETSRVVRRFKTKTATTRNAPLRWKNIKILSTNIYVKLF